jgi:hypothetical protein
MAWLDGKKKKHSTTAEHRQNCCNPGRAGPSARDHDHTQLPCAHLLPDDVDHHHAQLPVSPPWEGTMCRIVLLHAPVKRHRAYREERSRAPACEQWKRMRPMKKDSGKMGTIQLIVAACQICYLHNDEDETTTWMEKFWRRCCPQEYRLILPGEAWLVD